MARDKVALLERQLQAHRNYVAYWQAKTPQGRFTPAMQQKRVADGQARVALFEARLAAAQAQQAGSGSVPTAAQMATPSAAAILDPLAATKTMAAGMEVPSWLVPAAVGTGVVAAGVGVGALVASRRRKRKSSRKSKRKGGKSRSRLGKGGVRRGKKDRNRRGGAVRDKYKGRKVYRTKRGQPYILMRNGKARFIRA